MSHLYVISKYLRSPTWQISTSKFPKGLINTIHLNKIRLLVLVLGSESFVLDMVKMLSSLNWKIMMSKESIDCRFYDKL